MNKSLPNHLHAEQSVLGAIFLDPKRIIHAMDKVLVEDFFDLRHQLIYEAMIQANNENMKIDFTSVMSKLEQSNSLGKTGGLPYIIELSNFVPSTAHLDTHLDLVMDASLKRQVINTSSLILQDGYTANLDANEYIAKAEEMIFCNCSKA